GQQPVLREVGRGDADGVGGRGLLPAAAGPERVAPAAAGRQQQKPCEGACEEGGRALHRSTPASSGAGVRGAAGVSGSGRATSTVGERRDPPRRPGDTISRCRRASTPSTTSASAAIRTAPATIWA